MSQKPAQTTRYPSPTTTSTLRQDSKQPPSRPLGRPVNDIRPENMSRTNLLNAFDAEASSFDPILFPDTGGKPKDVCVENIPRRIVVNEEEKHVLRNNIDNPVF